MESALRNQDIDYLRANTLKNIDFLVKNKAVFDSYSYIELMNHSYYILSELDKIKDELTVAHDNEYNINTASVYRRTGKRIAEPSVQQRQIIIYQNGKPIIVDSSKYLHERKDEWNSMFDLNTVINPPCYSMMPPQNKW